MQLLIPMSGQGTRYQRAGYRVPKPLVPVNDRPMIERLLESIPQSWATVFVMAENHKQTLLPSALERIRPHATQDYVPVHSEGPLRAIEQGLRSLDPEQPVLVSYCDFGLIWDAHDFERFVQETECDMCVVSYKGFHAHYLNPVTYAYSRLQGQRVVEVREKGSFTQNREQEYASCGMYYFKSARLLSEVCKYQRDIGLKLNDEFYTSLTIEAGLRLGVARNQPLDTRIYEIPYFFQWGTPQDLKRFEYWERTYSAFRHFKSQPFESVGQVLMPMAGLGSRFQGISDRPKPFIRIENVPMFQRALETLPPPRSQTHVVGLEKFKELQPPKSYKHPVGSEHRILFKYLQATPPGQALSTEAGLSELSANSDVLVSSCDHGIVLNPQKWKEFLRLKDTDAAIFTVRGFPGCLERPKAFAYVQPEPPGPNDRSDCLKVKAVSVKQPLSATPDQDHLLTGTFWFRDPELLKEFIDELKAKDVRVNGELYLDSIFNLMIAKGKTVRLIELDGYINWGDPDSLAEALYWEEVFVGPKRGLRVRFPGVS